MYDTRIVGILNLTPDSFSDGGAFLRPDNALAHIRAMAEAGADVIDIGAESTRPGATPLTPGEEWQRLEPVLKALSSFPQCRFSIDTRHADTARKVIPIMGIEWINDVSGFSSAEMVDAVRPSACRLVVMHSLTIPADKKVVIPESEDVIETLMRFGKARIAALEAAGIGRERIIFDPGIGFGKTASQGMEIIRHAGQFKTLGVPVLIGHSRKSFLGASPGERDAATLEMSRLLVEQHIDYLRVHDVAAHRQLLVRMNERAYG